MAQRRRQAASAAAAGPSSSRESTTIDVPDVRLDDEDMSGLSVPANRAGTTLHPAAQHPLYATTSPVQSSFARAQSYQRRRKNATDPIGGDSGGGHLNGGGSDDYDNVKKSITSPTTKLTTLDRLEGWFGIQSSSNATLNSFSATDYVKRTSNGMPIKSKNDATAAAATSTKKSSRLVLVHVVTASDSLEGLALRFNTDVRTLRRANGLWPGDSVQVRKEVYIPVDEDAAQGGGTAGRQASAVVHQASEEANGKLSLLLNAQHHLLSTPSSSSLAQPHARSLSVTSASSSGATSQSQANSTAAVESTSASSARLSPPELRRVPAQSLSHFPPPGSSVSAAQAAIRGKGREPEQQEAFGFGLGLKTYNEEEDLQPGESGVEDLLQLAERARLRGSSSPSTVAREQTRAVQPSLNRTKSTQALRSEKEDTHSVVASSPALSSRDLDDDWRPNKWTLGQSGRRSHAASISHRSSYSNMSSAADNNDGDGRAGLLPPPPKGGNKPRVSQGWNDIPEPPLSKTAKGQVAHAYKPKRRYPRPGAGVDMPGSALIEDLAAGLPPNQGPASNWARPIGDSLPLPADEAHRRTASKAGGAGQTSAGWGQILSDTVRGKMRLEDALGRGIEDIRAGLSGTNVSGVPSDSMRSRPQVVQQAAGQRPSAELARAALSGPVVRPPPRSSGNATTGSADKANGTGQSTPINADAAADLRRGSGRSLHELEDLRVQHEHDEDDVYNNTTTTTAAPTPTQQDVYPAASSGHNTISSTRDERREGNHRAVGGGGEGGSLNRRNVQKVDWLG